MTKHEIEEEIIRTQTRIAIEKLRLEGLEKLLSEKKHK